MGFVVCQTDLHLARVILPIHCNAAVTEDEKAESGLKAIEKVVLSNHFIGHLFIRMTSRNRRMVCNCTNLKSDFRLDGDDS